MTNSPTQSWFPVLPHNAPLKCGAITTIAISGTRWWPIHLAHTSIQYRARRLLALALTISIILLAPGDVRATPSPTFSISTPTLAQTVSGSLTLSISTNNAAGTTVDFRLGSKHLGTVKLPATSITWNTGYASDGTYTVQATLRDQNHNILATASQEFTINNHGDTLSVRSPDLTRPITGKVNLLLSGSDSQHYPALWLVNIDGESPGGVWTDNTGTLSDSVSYVLDTTKYLNGRHELYIGMHSDFWPPGEQANKTWYNWTGGFDQVVDIENGKTLMDISANYLNVYLQPGGTATLSCQDLFTDYSTATCVKAIYAVSGGVVTVASDGTMTAGSSEGFATVVVSDGALVTQVYVWVREAAGIPHFAGNGEIMSAYDANRSLFVVAPFDLPANALAASPSLLSAIEDSGINTLSEGFYINPYDITYSFSNWLWLYNYLIAPEWEFAKANNFHVLATGDEICRNIGTEGWYTLNWPFGKAAVEYAMAGLAASGVAISVDMVDEVDFPWGYTPTPPGKVGAPGSFSSVACSSGNCTMTWPNNPVKPGRFPSGTNFALAGSANSDLNTPGGQMFQATSPTSNSFNFVAAGAIDGTFDSTTDPNLEFLYWAGNVGCPTQPCNPPVPNDALVQITSWLHEVQPNVPISWPVNGDAAVSVVANWMGPGSISDYASQYWVPLNQDHTYPWGAGIQEQGYWMSQIFYERQSATMIDRPQLLLDSVAGPYYQKNASGASYYTPPVDELEQPGPTPAAITSSIMTAAALGAAGVRLYYFEDPRNESARTAAPIGSLLQTGANPTANDPIIQANWRALSSASTALTQFLTPFVLGDALNSPAYGRNIVTAVRQGSNGKMLMIVNDNDWARTLSVDLQPYKTNLLAPTTRYLVNSDGITQASLPYISHDSITLAAGETVVYLLQTQGKGFLMGGHPPLRGLGVYPIVHLIRDPVSMRPPSQGLRIRANEPEEQLRLVSIPALNGKSAGTSVGTLRMRTQTALSPALTPPVVAKQQLVVPLDRMDALEILSWSLLDFELPVG
jgi:hypothetical protein